MKIIDLLNKIAKGEIKNKTKFWWYGCIHEIQIDYDSSITIYDTYCKKYKKIELNELNKEIKIIEEPKKIEKIYKINDEWQEDRIVDKINELIELINDMRDKE